MNINKLLQLGFSLLFLALAVGLLLAIIVTCHLPVMTVWVILALTAGIVCTAGSLEHHNNQKEDQK